MPHFSYINGRFLPSQHASISLQDRGLLFADSVYEVVCLIDGHFADLKGHLSRLKRSCREINLHYSSFSTLPMKIGQLVEKNKLTNGQIYIQISRGSARRDFPFPQNTQPNIFMLTKRLAPKFYQEIPKGVKIVTLPDLRWSRRDIKTTNLLPQVLAKQQAIQQNAKEAWMIGNDSFVTEGSSSNAWIITKDNTLVTRPADQNILSGITRSSLLKIAEKLEITIDLRPFTVEEAYQAKEAFLSSATTFVTPIIQINDQKIADGKIGALTKKLLHHYIQYGQKAKNDYEWTPPF